MISEVGEAMMGASSPGLLGIDVGDMSSGRLSPLDDGKPGEQKSGPGPFGVYGVIGMARPGFVVTSRG